jgi:hypothetical protein
MNLYKSYFIFSDRRIDKFCSVGIELFQGCAWFPVLVVVDSDRCLRRESSTERAHGKFVSLSMLIHTANGTRKVEEVRSLAETVAVAVLIQ